MIDYHTVADYTYIHGCPTEHFHLLSIDPHIEIVVISNIILGIKSSAARRRDGESRQHREHNCWTRQHVHHVCELLNYNST